MQSVDSYLSEIIAAITPLPPEEIPLTEAGGAVLAADAVTSWPLPGFDNSAMDGYAVRAADVAGASAENPVALPVDAEIAAGDTAAYTLAPGRSIKIMTGALLPAAAARQAGCEATRHPRLRDEADEVLAAIEQAAATADLLMTSGGVSMGGEHDVVKAALTKLGTVMFRKVAMQPGMPQGFGLIGDDPQTPLFTLPGNPVSAFVSFRLLVEPAVPALQGLPAQPAAPRQPRLAAP